MRGGIGGSSYSRSRGRSIINGFGRSSGIGASSRSRGGIGASSRLGNIGIGGSSRIGGGTWSYSRGGGRRSGRGGIRGIASPGFTISGRSGFGRRGGISGINLGGSYRRGRSNRFLNRWSTGGYGYNRYSRRSSWGFYLSSGYYGWGLGFGLGYYPGSYYFGFPYVPSYAGYYNPYCVSSPYFPTQYTVYNYSQPITQNQSPDDKVADLMASADNAFHSGDYKTALSYVDAAVKELPQNAGVHQFRALVLFAMGQYRDSAAAAHVALTGGPGWNWPTLRSFYPSKETYTVQLRALEAYRSKNKQDAASRFLLGYHYMMLGHSDAAAGELVRAIELEPRDKLSAELLAAISKKTGKTYTPNVSPGGPKVAPVPPLPDDGTPAKAVKPAPAAKFAGTWKSTQPDGTKVTLKLLAGGKFEWTAAHDDRSTKLAGTYTMVKDHLKLTADKTGQVLEGQLSSQTKDAFQWKLKWQEPDEPGLTFKRQ